MRTDYQLTLSAPDGTIVFERAVKAEHVETLAAFLEQNMSSVEVARGAYDMFKGLAKILDNAGAMNKKPRIAVKRVQTKRR